MKLRKITEFGKILRKIRIDNNEILKDMAEKLNVTLSHLSAVETGKRNIPEKWQDIIIEKYDLNKEEKKQLKKAILHSATEIKINTKNLDKCEKELVFSFVKYFKDLDKQDIDIIKHILLKKDSKELNSFSTRND